MYGSEERYFLV